MIPATEVIHRSDLRLGRTYDHVMFRVMPPFLVSMLKGRVTGLTVGATVFVHPDEWDRVELGFNPRLVAHELRHVDQWDAGGLGFLFRYLFEYVRFRIVGANHDAAYTAISYEIDARAFADDAALRPQ